MGRGTDLTKVEKPPATHCRRVTPHVCRPRNVTFIVGQGLIECIVCSKTSVNSVHRLTAACLFQSDETTRDRLMLGLDVWTALLCTPVMFLEDWPHIIWSDYLQMCTTYLLHDVRTCNGFGPCLFFPRILQSSSRDAGASETTQHLCLGKC